VDELWRRFGGLSLVHGAVPPVLTAGVVVGLLALVTLRRSRRWYLRSVPLAVLAALLLLAVGELGLAVLKPFPDRLPWIVPGWVGAALLGLCLAVAGWRRQRTRRRVLAALALLLVLAGSANAVNRVYAPFPTVAAALQLPPHDMVPSSSVLTAPGLGAAAAAVPAPESRPLAARWQPPAGMPRTGAVTEVTIPGVRSGFTTRPAWLYVPPAYLTAQRPLLPVLVLLSGQPGSPRDWVDAGGVTKVMNAFAAAHSGLAPVVVMPDALGAETANPLCMDSRLGAADTYLSVDVPAFIGSRLQVDPDRAHWSVGGFSYGGTCALQLAVAHPDLFPTFLDISGQQRPTLGNPARTVAKAFGGDQAALDAVDPLHELAGRRLPGTRALLAVGAHDARFQAQAATVRTALTAAGADVTSTEVPGGHSWTVASAALAQALPTIAQRTGLTG
jgi:S-formylglutathione hydrolase FrmB